MAKKKAKQKQPQLTFEQSLEALQQVVEELEDGNLTLTESLEKYEFGIKQLKSCHSLLREAEGKIELLVGLDEQGNLKTTDFDGTATQFGGDFTDPESAESADVDPMDEDGRLF